MNTTAIQTETVQLNLGFFHLQDVSLSIPKGQMTAIIGPNGSGKSTILKIITQLLKADEGAVYISNKQVKEYSRKEFAKELTMMPQAKEHLPDLTVRELISYGRAPHKRLFNRESDQEDEKMIEWALEITGTKKYEHRMFHAMSGGEQQKVRIAMALAQKTNILLLDEPTTYLDIAHQLELMEMLKRINKEYEITIVMVLHELQQAAKYCDYLIAMKKGKVVDSGSPHELLTSAFFKLVYGIEAKVRFEDEYPLIIPISVLGVSEKLHEEVQSKIG